MQKITKAIIPAAGFGTRFLPATKSQPKEMLPVVDKPTIQYIVEEAVESGIEDILIVIGRYKSSIEDHFDRSVELEMELEKKGKYDMLEQIQNIAGMANIQFVRQKTALGLGHAVYCARNFIGNEPFAVMLGDDIVDSPGYPCLKQMIDLYEHEQCTILGVKEVAEQDISKYGIVDGDKLGEGLYSVRSLVEKPKPEAAPSNVAIMGRYIITPEIFNILEKTAPGAGNEIQLTDALKTLALKEKMLAYAFKGRRHDVGDKLGFLQATVEFALQREDLKDDFIAYLEQIVAAERAK
ncbi:MAG: UTP--glucose-1-phosphate uridylyltransferase GalU [Peptococcaceae bacterium]|nr:UTP--glucose-1-phosphate uridylyltransferase GalU [Peptococcaceae bacterium]MBO5428744.1 UTP--glucose-1-phosphate uridylyltransferase GalU [Peptococcaceae bacterium]